MNRALGAPPKSSKRSSPSAAGRIRSSMVIPPSDSLWERCFENRYLCRRTRRRQTSRRDHRRRRPRSSRSPRLVQLRGQRWPHALANAPGVATDDVPWHAVRIFQVDERIAPAGDPDRNLTHLRESLAALAPFPPDLICPMPVESPNPAAAATQYAHALEAITGSPPVLDLAHLGLGPDGHTASLVPGDPVLEVADRDVALTGIYMGRRRMTLTYPVLNRARRILWLVTGAEKADKLAQLIAADPAIPAGRIRQDVATVLADDAAAASIKR